MLIHDLSEKWADYMVAQGAPQQNRDVFAYGLECTLNELICDVILLAAAVGMEQIWEMVCFIVSFNIQRTFVGGYHAKTPAGCLIGSVAAGLACVWIYPLLTGRRILELVLSLVCLAIVWKTAPVIHPNHPVSEERQRTFRVLARIVMIGMGALTVGLGRIFPELAALLCTTGVCACVLALTGKYQTAAT